MADTLALAAVATTVLTEGVKFLYTQAGEVLKSWRTRKETAVANQASTPPTHPASSSITLPPAFEGQLVAPQLHFDVVERLATTFSELRKDLSEYAEEVETVDRTNAHLLQQIDALRQSLEAVYQQRFTLRGEHRPPSGPMVEGGVEVDEVLGYAAAVRARTVRSGQITGQARAQQVGSDGTLLGVDIDTLGD